MLDLTFLSEEQVFDDNQLDIFKEKVDIFGDNQLYTVQNNQRECIITDFTSLLGVVYQDTGSIFGDWWTKSPNEDDNITTVDVGGNSDYSFADVYDIGIRPAFVYSSIKSDFSNKVREVSGIKEIEYGEYPQWAVDEENSLRLEELYNDGKIRETGKKYTTYFSDIDYEEDEDGKTVFSERTHIEYEYDGKKYIRFVGDVNSEDGYLKDGREIEDGKIYWISVEPIVWLVDEKNDIALSKYIIVSGIQFDDKDIYKGDFENTVIKRFMDTYLAKEIECSLADKLIENKSYDFDRIFEDAIKKMNEINEKEKSKKLTKKITN